MRDDKVKRLALGGILAALVTLATLFLKVPVPITNGYVHLGDGVIFLAALLLGPYAALPAGIGSALADLLGGYMIYIVPSFVIKAAMGLIVGYMARKGALARNILWFALAELVMVGGYFVLEGFIYGWAGAAGAMLPNAMQGLAGVGLGALFSAMLPRLDRGVTK